MSRVLQRGGRSRREERNHGRWQLRLIVATNAFGLGIDAPDVRAVIHVGAIYQMRNYSQESGRGGRDGQRSEAVVVMPVGKQEAFQKKHARAGTRSWKIQSRVMSSAEAKKIECDKMERFLSGEKCRRIFLDAEMDGREDRVRCEEGEERCDVCENDDAMMAESEAQRVAYVREEQERRQREEPDERIDGWIAALTFPAAFPVKAMVFRSSIAVQRQHYTLIDLIANIVNQSTIYTIIPQAIWTFCSTDSCPPPSKKCSCPSKRSVNSSDGSE